MIESLSNNPKILYRSKVPLEKVSAVTKSLPDDQESELHRELFENQ